ncbi:phage tail assembly chaperone [Orbus wheelerorum]|uniref:phage tail assembly chaperone n=1 Tax=Orbus wheelerorum TaxID=3074111 RepID=UPI00370D12EF
MQLFKKSKLKDKLAAKNSGFRHVLVEAPDFDNAKFMVFEPPLKDWMAYVSVVKLCSEDNETTEDIKAKKLIEAEAKLFIRCVRDENGDPIFGESELSELINVFGNNHSRILEKGLELLTLKQNPLEVAEKK